MDSNEAFETRYFSKNKKMMKILGVWPYNRKKQRILIRTFVMMIMGSFILPQVIKGLEECVAIDRKLEIIVECFIGFIFTTGTILKYCQSIIMENQLCAIYKRFTSDRKQLQNKKEEIILLQSWNLGHTCFCIYAGYVCSGWFGFAVLPVVTQFIPDFVSSKNESHSKKILLYTEYYVDQQEYYWYIYTHIFISSLVIIFVIIAMDTTYVNCICHCVGLYDILKYRMNRMNQLTEEKLKCDLIQATELHEYIKKAIEFHINAIELFYMIRQTWSICNFLNMVGVLMDLSVGSIMLVHNIHNPVFFIRVFLLWFGHIMYLFFITYPGQRLLSVNEEFFQSIYFCGWYKLHIKTRYLINFMLMRCLIPCQLTAGPMLKMNLEHFGSILKKAMSYFTVMLSINE